MFRNPRENAQRPPEQRLTPSVGRPPSPPGTRSAPQENAVPSIMATRTVPSKSSVRPAQTPSKPQQTTLTPSSWSKKSNTKSGGGGQVKDRPKANGNILTFFKKAEAANNTIFLEDRRLKGLGSAAEENADLDEVGWESNSPEARRISHDRFNENGGSDKRRKISFESQDLPAPKSESPTIKESSLLEVELPETSGLDVPAKGTGPRGPFLQDSDDEEEEDHQPSIRRNTFHRSEALNDHKDVIGVEPKIEEQVQLEENPIDTPGSPPPPPALIRESTSCAPDDAFADFEGEDFEEDLEGEEYDERVWMEEQRRLEMIEAGLITEDGDDIEDAKDPKLSTLRIQDGSSEQLKSISCPICESSLSGLTEEDVSVHVNSCLDGNPLPLPKKQTPKTESTPPRPDNHRRFQKSIRQPKPGQENPFVLGEDLPQKSAFSKLMSNHAEDIAWQAAAASEQAARGKPAYQRTCPFYKILPGFYICVDAFRYGAVKDCQAYFLSHFHSDHYVGLTSSWSHGPIYCSKVTANLVKQQLRVDPKYVVALEFEATIDVPGTKGVKVTMIPANHCPGSSLFLFEKTIGSGKYPKKQRVLHCGDFRACQAHVEHPLLRPDVKDALGRSTGQQKIDVCYLDTTYLNPKYAFPSQDEVIKACAEMCLCLNKIHADESDGWETMKRARAGEGMVKFVQKGTGVKSESENGDESESAPQQTQSESKARGRLLVVVGTYSIGKERMCLGIARALNSKIYAPASKQRICAALEDPEINARLTSNPREAQVHMTPLFEIRADTLDEYLNEYREDFSRAVGFRPTGWNYRPPNSRFVESPSVQTVLHSANWKSTYTMRELAPQRGSTSRASCFGVPYSEHSSFRELTMFCCALRIDKIIPTVNVGSAKSRERMKSWCDRWAMEKKKNGLFRPGEGESSW